MNMTDMVGTSVSVVPGSGDGETLPGKNMIAVLDDAGSPVGRQSAGADRVDQAIGEFRPGVKYRCDEHIAGNAAQSIQLNVHCRGSRAGQWRKGR
jgi:hypothetical protein